MTARRYDCSPSNFLDATIPKAPLKSLGALLRYQTEGPSELWLTDGVTWRCVEVKL